MTTRTLEQISEELNDILKARSNEDLNEPLNHQGYVIVRTYSAGVHIGFLKRLDETTQTVELTKARRICKWEKALTLSEISKYGVGNQSKLSEEIEKIILLEAIEVLFVTPEAKTNLRTVKAYKND